MKRAVAITIAALTMAHGALAASADNSLQRAMDRGKTMYLYDRAAWLTSDDLIARLPPERREEVGGWIVTSSASGQHVDYFGTGTSAERVVYSADVTKETVSNSTVFPASAEPILKGPALQMVRALRAARTEMSHRSDWRSCTRAPFNTIVLPPEQDGMIPVYFLTPQTEVDEFPFGGHYEVDIAPDGRVATTRAFTNSCLAMPKSAKNGVMPAAIFVTHILDPHPTEIHVFEQYYVGMPVFVGTGPKSVWKVENGAIEDVSAMMAK